MSFIASVLFSFTSYGPWTKNDIIHAAGGGRKQICLWMKNDINICWTNTTFFVTKGRQFSVGENEYTPAPCCFRILSRTLCAYIDIKIMPDVGMGSWWEIVLILLKLVGKFITWQSSVGSLTRYSTVSANWCGLPILTKLCAPVHTPLTLMIIYCRYKSRLVNAPYIPLCRDWKSFPPTLFDIRITKMFQNLFEASLCSHCTRMLFSLLNICVVKFCSENLRSFRFFFLNQG